MNTFDNFNNLNFNYLNNFNHHYKICDNFSINIEKLVKINLADVNDYYSDLYSRIPHHSQR